MISSILPTIDNALSLRAAPDEATPVDKTRPVEATAPVGETASTDIRAVRRAERAAPSSFLHAAKHMVKDAMQSFRHGLKETFEGLGFEDDLFGQMTRAVMQPVKQAFRSGVDFAANVMVAVVSQTSGPAGAAAGAFNIVVSSLDIEVNHTEGTVDVSSGNISIEGEVPAGAAAGPRLFDATDSEAPPLFDIVGELRALLSFDDLFDGGDESPAAAEATEPAVEDAPAPSTPVEDPVDAAPEAAPEDGAAAEAPTEATAAAPVGATALAESLSDVLRDLFGERTRARITVLAFDRFLDDDDARISRVSLQATIPLAAPTPDRAQEAGEQPADAPDEDAEETTAEA